MLTQDINQNTRITLRKLPTDALTTEVLIERDCSAKDGSRTKTQMFLTNEEMLHLEDTIANYNQMFVDPQMGFQQDANVIDV